MQVAHPGEDVVVRLRVLLERQASVLVQRLGDGRPQLILVCPRLGHDCHAVDGGRILDFSVLVRRSALRAQRVPHLRALKLRDGHDVAGDDLLDVAAVLAAHHLEGADPLVLALLDVVDVVAVGGKPAGVDADKGQLADVGVHHDLEAEGRKRVVQVRLHLDGLLALIRLDAADVHRGGEVIRDEVQHLRHPDVRRRRPRQDGHHAARDDGHLQRSGQVRLGHGPFSFVQVLLHQGVVHLDGGLQQRLPCRLCGVGHVGGDGFFGKLSAAVQRVLVGLSLQDVNDAAELVRRTDGEKDRQRVRRELLMDVRKDLLEVRVLPVHLRDIEGDGHALIPGVLPGAPRLDLDAAHRADQDHGGVGDADCGTHLPREVGIARGVQDEERLSVPLHRQEGGAD